MGRDREPVPSGSPPPLAADDPDAEPCFAETDRLIGLCLDEQAFIRLRPEVEHERAVAIFDLLEDNQFAVPGFAGPFRLILSLDGTRLVFDLRDADDGPLTRLRVSVVPFRSVVKDYFLVCSTYFSAIKTKTPSQIEAIDMGRRSLHNEGATLFRNALAGRVNLDFDTARRLFTLLCVLHIRG